MINGTYLNISVSYHDGKIYSFRFLVESSISTIMLAQSIAFIPDIDMKSLEVNKSDAGMVDKSTIQYIPEIEDIINQKFGLNMSLSLINKGETNNG